jgi:hypothetical protein
MFKLGVMEKSAFVVDLVLVGAASAAKLLFRTITLLDKWVLVVKSTFVVDLFVPKGTPTRRGRYYFLL